MIHGIINHTKAAVLPGTQGAYQLGGKDMVEVMTNEQFETILEMIRMILDGCDDIETAKRKIDDLIQKAQKK